jgi:hypothetical protein
MAKELLISRWLSEEMIVAGSALVARLAAENAQLAAACWVQFDVEKAWKLLLISPLVAEQGPRRFYKRVNDVNKALGEQDWIVSLHDIDVSTPQHRLIQALKASVLFGAELRDNRFGQNYFNGVYVEDMYLYQLDWALIADKALAVV